MPGINIHNYQSCYLIRIALNCIEPPPLVLFKHIFDILVILLQVIFGFIFDNLAISKYLAKYLTS